MKAQLVGKGSSTLEILIATTIIMMTCGAVVSVVFGSQSLVVDIQTNNRALSMAQEQLETTQALVQKDFLAASTTAPTTQTIGGLTYLLQTEVSDLSPCEKQATSTVSWSQSSSRPQSISFTTFLTDVTSAIARGGDCVTGSLSGLGWKSPARFASDTTPLAKSTALDELSRVVYLGIDKSPFFKIADTRHATLDQTSGLFGTYANGFDEQDVIYGLDAVWWHDPSTHAVKTYVFVATASTTAQLKVIDTTDIFNPVVVATRTLAGVASGGSFPQGWRVLYYKDRLYIVTRETTGPEFHTFDVSIPTNPVELGSGVSINITVEDMAVQERIVGGVRARYLFFATDQNSAEVKVYDVTDPTNSGVASEVVAARQDLVGTQDGASVFAIGNKLYVGRQSSSGADLYIYDCSNPNAGMPFLGSKDIGTGVIGIVVSGKFAFLSTLKANQEFQVWDVSNPAVPLNVAIYNFGTMSPQGIDFDPDFIYAAGQSAPNFQILYNP